MNDFEEKLSDIEAVIEQFKSGLVTRQELANRLLSLSYELTQFTTKDANE